ncbi:MAG: Heparinase II/III-like protein [Chloroflexi bacterium ADurb.Bin325]|nr:MAG: Heparinase II/III-like protein [Chloroflexi bacterium ADurb.Bin325]
MRLNAVQGLAGLALAVLSLSAQEPPAPGKATDEAVASAVGRADKRHPRLFADAAGFDALRAQAAASAFGKLAAGRVLFEADQMLAFPPCAREMEGRRLLAVSRRALHRVSTLAMAYRLSGRPAYLERCAAEMRAAAGFTDWNPSHFLDVAEMTLALAVGYDWLYNELDEASRRAVADAILEKGLRASLKQTGWVNAGNNWGQVCHAGMLAGALALLEEQEALAVEITRRAVSNLPRPMRAFAPKGCYPEGPGYWSYGTTYNVILIALLESVFGSDFGLSQAPGFDKTGQYLSLVTGPSGLAFNYADGSAGRDTDCASWWFARRFSRPDTLAYFEKDAFLAHCSARGALSATRGGNRLFAFTLFWLQPLPDGAPAPRAPLAWSSEGAVPITVQRSSWDKGKALFVGLKAGSPSGPHGHMDAGSFVLDADGVRWAYDLGAENYHRIESRNMGLWNSKQDSDRWRVFRLSSLSHNTLVIDGQLQLAQGRAEVVSFREGPEPEAVLDLTPVYTNAAQVLRTGTLLATGEYRLTDTLKGLRPGARVRWGMVTRAKPDARRAGHLVLRAEGKQLRLSPLHDPATAWFASDLSKPRNEWDSPNKGMVMVGFETVAPASGELALAVLFTPGSVNPAGTP